MLSSLRSWKSKGTCLEGGLKEDSLVGLGTQMEAGRSRRICTRAPRHHVYRACVCRACVGSRAGSPNSHKRPPGCLHWPGLSSSVCCAYAFVTRCINTHFSHGKDDTEADT